MGNHTLRLKQAIARKLVDLPAGTKVRVSTYPEAEIWTKATNGQWCGPAAEAEAFLDAPGMSHRIYTYNMGDPYLLPVSNGTTKESP